MVQITGGDKLEAQLKILSRVAKNSATLSVGFLEGSTYPDGTSVPMVAAVQEFGSQSQGIPPRPFFRQAVEKNRGGWPILVSKLLAKYDWDAEKTLMLTGEIIKAQLQQSIIEFSGVPLKPETVKRKGFDKQLIETGVLLDGVDYKVET